jgi:CBS domain-containing protein
MNVQDILASKANSIISFIGPNDKVTDAVRFMCDSRIGSLLVQGDKGSPVGIITERDVLRAINEDFAAYPSLRVSDIMTTELICGLPKDDVNYVMQIMTQNKIRHLPIVEKKRVVGLISIGDVINSSLEESKVENRRLHDYLQLSGEM